jgi:UPF0271 protein
MIYSKMDINCDLGEGMGNDAEIMAYINSCNIACGGHAGDKDTMIKTLHLAKKHGVKAGAHTSFEDKKNFGRMDLSVSKGVLKAQLINQIDALNQLAKAENMKLHHVKAHGALYNMAAKSGEIAQIIVEAVQFFEQNLYIYVPFDSELEKKAKIMGVPYKIEVFADRNYDDDFNLLSRKEPLAVLETTEEVKSRVEKMIREGTLISLHGIKRSINFDTLCVHGDHPHALEIVRELSYLKRRLN